MMVDFLINWMNAVQEEPNHPARNSLLIWLFFHSLLHQRILAAVCSKYKIHHSNSQTYKFYRSREQREQMYVNTSHMQQHLHVNVPQMSQHNIPNLPRDDRN